MRVIKTQKPHFQLDRHIYLMEAERAHKSRDGRIFSTHRRSYYPSIWSYEVVMWLQGYLCSDCLDSRIKNPSTVCCVYFQEISLSLFKSLQHLIWNTQTYTSYHGYPLRHSLIPLGLWNTTLFKHAKFQIRANSIFT